MGLLERVAATHDARASRIFNYVDVAKNFFSLSNDPPIALPDLFCDIAAERMLFAMIFRLFA
jgi:hypothetical protein